jgi:hypothetical protein
LREREVFLREIEYFSFGEAIKTFLRLTPLDCSKIEFKRRKFRPSSISSYSKKLKPDQREFIIKRTNEEFLKSTKIKRKLQKKNKEDLPYMWHWNRIYECVLKNYMLFQFVPSTYQLSESEASAIEDCADNVLKSTERLQGIVGKAFSSFRSYLEIQDIQKEPSFFEQATKYIVLAACFLLINSIPAIGILTTLVGKKSATILDDTINDITSKYVEDVVDKAYNDKEAKPKLKEKKISLSEYLTLTDMDNFVLGLKQQRDAYNMTKTNLITAINSKFDREGEKDLILQNFRRDSRIKKEQIMSEGVLERFFFIETMKLFADFINSSSSKQYKKPSGGGFIFGQPRQVNREFFDLELKGEMALYSGVIGIRLEIIEWNLSDLMTRDVKITKINAGITVHSSPSDNVKKGLKKLMKEFRVNEVWGNPFDMPVRKFLNLRFKDSPEVSIYMDFFATGPYPLPTYPSYRLTYYYKEPWDIAYKKGHFNSYPRGDSSEKIPYNLGMESLFGKPSCDNLLLNLFNDQFKNQFSSKEEGKRSLNRPNILNWNTDSLDIIKEKTRSSLLGN